MKKVSNFDVFLVIWCSFFTIFEIINLLNGNYGIHVMGLAVQLSFGALALKSIIEDLQ